MPRSALFIIDIQRELAQDPATRIPHSARITTAGTRILAAARTIIDGFRGEKQPSPSILVFVQHEEEKGTLVRGSEGWKLVFEPRCGAGEEEDGVERLIGKSTGDAFESNPELAVELKAQDIDEIVAFGIQSECCVRATSLGALKAGFKVTLLQGAHSTYDDGGKTAVEIEREVEEELKSKGAKVVPWEDALAAWQQRNMVSCYDIFPEIV